MHYTQRMLDLRQDRGLKQSAVAMTLGITRQQYQLYESGKRKLPIDLLPELCTFYNVSADYFLGLTDTYRPFPKK